MYSAELINEIKECYPEFDRLHELVDSGSAWVGKYLDDSREVMDIPFILNAKTLKEVKDRARVINRKEFVYRMWRKEDPRGRGRGW